MLNAAAAIMHVTNETARACMQLAGSINRTYVNIGVATQSTRISRTESR